MGTRVPRYVREIALVAALFLVYKVGRSLTAGDAQVAIIHAYDVWNVERWLRLPDELDLQQLFLQWPRVIKAANAYYAWVHFPVTALFLVWLYLRDHAGYVRIRNVMVLLTMSALALHVLVPLAPPRMLGSLGFVDTGAMYGQSVYDSGAGASISNQFAALPSLHVGWALVVAYGIITQLHSRWRWLALLHPLITTFVVVTTANHFWIDAIVAALLLAVALVVIRPAPSPVVAGSVGKAEVLAG
jgi:PAP2 superfamily